MWTFQPSISVRVPHAVVLWHTLVMLLKEMNAWLAATAASAHACLSPASACDVPPEHLNPAPGRGLRATGQRDTMTAQRLAPAYLST